MWDPEAIRALALILTETGLTEIEIEEKDSRIRVARSVTTTTAVSLPAVASPAPLPAPAPSAPVDEAAQPGAVTSPMVGIAYLSPEPGAAAFISVGQMIAAGQTLLLIEAMKTFNQIKAPHAGTVSKIAIASGAPVEYGQLLVVVDP